MMKFLFKGTNNLIFFRVHKIQERRLTVSSLPKSFRASVMVSLLVLMLGFSKLWMCTMGMGTFFGRWDSYEFWNILCQTQGMISKGISPFWLVGGAKNISRMEFCPGRLLDSALEFLNGVEMLGGPLSCHNHWEHSLPF